MEAATFLHVLERLRDHPRLQSAPIYRMKQARGRDPFAVLVTTLLSSRTQDPVTVQAAERLLARAPTPNHLAHMDPGEIARLIYPVGFYRTKAKHLQELARILITHHGGQVPADRTALIRLPGVGRKTANLVLAEAFGVPAICVDTHVHRITNRLGVVTSKTPEETEHQLEQRVPQRYWPWINTLLVALGQTLCLPRWPRCSICPVRDLCERRGVSQEPRAPAQTGS